MQEQEQEQGQAGTGHVRWVEAVGLGAACASNGSRVCRWFSPSVRRYATGDGESGWWVTGGAVCRWEGARRWGRRGSETGCGFNGADSLEGLGVCDFDGDGVFPLHELGPACTAATVSVMLCGVMQCNVM